MNTRNDLADRMKQLSPAQKAELLAKLKRKKQADNYQVEPLARDRVNWPVSHTQSRMWLLQKFEGAQAHNYNLSAAARVRGSLDYERLQNAFDQVCARHESLRTKFVQADDGIMQSVVDTLQIKITPIDFTHLNPSEALSQATDIANKISMTPFDLTEYGQTNVHLMKLAHDDYMLLLNQHHIIADGWSLTQIVKEWCFFYNYADAVTIPDSDYVTAGIAKNPTQFIDYAQWQDKALKAGVFDKQYKYWEHQLDGAPAVCALPVDMPHQERAVRQGGFHKVVLETQVVAGFRQLSAQRGTSLFAMLQGCFHALMYRFGAGDDIVTGMAIANRNHDQALESVVGFLANSLPIRTVLSREITLDQILKQSHETTMAAQENQDIPLDLLVEHMNAPRLPGRTPLFQSMMVLQNTPNGGASFGTAPMEQVRLDTESAKFDLVVQFMPQPDGMALEVTYDRHLYHEARIAHFANAFVHVLNNLERNLAMSVDDMPLSPQVTDTGPIPVQLPETAMQVMAQDADICCSASGSPLPDYASGFCTGMAHAYPAFKTQTGICKALNYADTGWIGDYWINLSWLKSQLAGHPKVRSVSVHPIWMSQSAEPHADLAVFVVPLTMVADSELMDIWRDCIPDINPPAHFALVSADVIGNAWATLPSVGYREKNTLLDAMAADNWDNRDIGVTLQTNVPQRKGRDKSQICRPLCDQDYEVPLSNKSEARTVDVGEAYRKEDAPALPASTQPAIFTGPALPASHDCSVCSLRDVLLRAVNEHPENGVTFVTVASGTTFKTYPEIYQQALLVLSGMQQTGIQQGDKILLCQGDEQTLVTSIWACFLGGIVPVMCTVPPDFANDHPILTRLEVVAHNLPDSPIILSRVDAEAFAQRPEKGRNPVRCIEDMLLRGQNSEPILPAISPSDDALVMLTSGSTGAPKMVLHGHTSLIHQARAFAHVYACGEDRVSLNWLPLDHVGGLLMFHLQGVFDAIPQVQVQTNYVLEQPLNWMRLCSDYRVTITWAPNFAFGLAARALERLAQDSSAAPLDLSSMRTMLNGAEAVVGHVVERFCAAAKPFGLDPASMAPVWGMSETSSAVTSMRGYKLCTETNAVCLGQPLPSVQMRILDSQGQLACEGEIGHLEVAGPTMLKEYFDHPKANRDSFSDDGWFRTGDLAFLKGGALYFSGRDKDIIVVNGVNYDQSDIETAVENVSGVSPSYTAACGIVDGNKDTESLAIFFVPVAFDMDHLRQTITEIGDAVFAVSGLSPDILVPVHKDRIPKTSIGKIQRSQLVQDYGRGAFAADISRVKAVQKRPQLVRDYQWSVAWQDLGLDVARSHDGCTRLIPAQETFFLSSDLSRSAALSAAGMQCLGRLDAMADVSDRTVTLKGMSGVVLHLTGELQARADIFMQLSNAAQQLSQMFAAQNVDPTMRLPVLCVVDADCMWPAASEGILPGLLASLGRDFPNLTPTLVEVVPASDGRDLSHCLDWLPHLWGREGRYRLVPQATGFTLQRHGLKRCRTPVPTRVKNPLFRRDHAHVIVGGTGGIGVVIAQFLLRSGAHVVLMGRSMVGSELDAELSRLAMRHGGSWQFARADVTDELMLHKCLAELNAERVVGAIWHLAGVGNLQDHLKVIDDRRADRMSAEEIETFFKAKGDGAAYLVSSLDFLDHAKIIGFSSVNALFGGASFAAYSAANSLMTEIVSHAPADRIKILHWSQWQDTGMSQGNDDHMIALADSIGLKCLSHDDALAGLEAALSSPDAEVAIGLDPNNLNIAWRISGDLFPLWRLDLQADVVAGLPDVGRNCMGVPFDIGQTNAGDDAGGDGGLEETPLFRSFEAKVQAIWNDDLGLPATNPEENFFDVGGSSVLIVQLHRALQDMASTTFPITELFNRPTIRSQAHLLYSRDAALASEGDGGAIQGGATRPDEASSARGASRRQRMINRRKSNKKT